MINLWIVFFVVGLALLCWGWWFSIRESAREQATRSATQPLIAEFRSTFDQAQLEMVGQIGELHQAGHFGEAAMLVDRLLTAVTDHNSGLYVHLLLIKLECLLKQNQIDQAERACGEYIQENVSKEQKLKMLDGAASYILYHSLSAFLKQAERFARMGLEMAPGTLTLKGTLGSILAEQGNYAGAEPLLRECLDRSPALHDRAIASFYLGVIKIRNSNVKEGKRLMKRGMKMYPEAWMIAKGNALLK